MVSKENYRIIKQKELFLDCTIYCPWAANNLIIGDATLKK